MKAFLAGVLAATVLAIYAALVLNGGIQRSASEAYSTEAVRL